MGSTQSVQSAPSAAPRNRRHAPTQVVQGTRVQFVPNAAQETHDKLVRAQERVRLTKEALTKEQQQVRALRRRLQRCLKEAQHNRAVLNMPSAPTAAPRRGKR